LAESLWQSRKSHAVRGDHVDNPHDIDMVVFAVWLFAQEFSDELSQVLKSCYLLFHCLVRVQGIENFLYQNFSTNKKKLGKPTATNKMRKHDFLFRSQIDSVKKQLDALKELEYLALSSKLDNFDADGNVLYSNESKPLLQYEETLMGLLESLDSIKVEFESQRKERFRLIQVIQDLLKDVDEYKKKCLELNLDDIILAAEVSDDESLYEDCEQGHEKSLFDRKLDQLIDNDEEENKLKAEKDDTISVSEESFVNEKKSSKKDKSLSSKENMFDRLLGIFKSEEVEKMFVGTSIGIL